MWKNHNWPAKKSSTVSRSGLARKSRNQEEQNEQRTLILICEAHQWKYPELAMLFHVPNGGLRSKIEAAILSGMGVRSGVPDLVLPVARRGWFGAYIELKRPGSIKNVSPNQEKWLHQLTMQGYISKVFDSANEAWSFIEWYIDGSITRSTYTPEVYE